MYLGLLPADASAQQVQAAISALPGIHTAEVLVKRQALPSGFLYQVTFISKLGDYDLLSYEVAPQSNLTLHVTETKKGVPSLEFFSLCWDGRLSTPLPARATANQVLLALEELQRSWCPPDVSSHTEGSHVVFFQDYEVSTSLVSGKDRGKRTDKGEAFCGSFSLHRPSVLFAAGDHALGKDPYKPIKLAIHRQLCFAHKGDIAASVGLTLSWIWSDGSTANQYRIFSVPLRHGQGWQYSCVDLLAAVLAEPQFAGGSAFTVKRINLLPGDHGGDFYVDTVYIGRRPSTSNPADSLAQRLPAIHPGGMLKWTFGVTSIPGNSTTAAMPSFNITITPQECDHDLPLISIAFSQAVRSSATEAEHRAPSWPAGVTVLVERLQAASPPISGSFDVEMHDQVIRGLPWNILADDLREELEAVPKLGRVQVERTGTCFGYTWKVKWLESGGDQPALQVNGSGLQGQGVNARIHVHQDGGVFIRHIRGDLLRTPHFTPQVEVFINGVPSRCVENCSFSWHENETPRISYTSPGSGSGWEGTMLKIRGLRLKVEPEIPRVTIGDVLCAVVNASDAEISCRVGMGAAGILPINIMVPPLGRARSMTTHTFSFTMAISNISPAKGPSTGGSMLTLTGHGFCPNIMIRIGTGKCVVRMVNLTTVFCITPAALTGEATIVNATARCGNISTKSASSFKFIPVIPATIISVSPRKSSVAGGGNLTLMGVGFGEDGAVTVGDAACPVLVWSNESVICQLPSLPPGLHVAHLSIGLNGYAKTAIGLETSVEYVLVVKDMRPHLGSLCGGTRLIFTGEGFNNNPADTIVTIGTLQCDVKNSSWSQVECDTPDLTQEHIVTNWGSHPGFGEGYAWSPAHLSLFVGDTVTWKWRSPPFNSALRFRIYSVTHASSLSYNGGHLYSSDSGTPTGNYSYRCNSSGIFYYTSGLLNPAYPQLHLSGVLFVSLRPAHLATPRVTHAGHVARMHYIEPDISPGTVTSNVSRTAAKREARGDCTVTVQQGDCPLFSVPTGGYSFLFAACASPLITEISPVRGNGETLITVSGSLFASKSCSNQVSVGGYPCEVVSSTPTFISCRLDPMTSMPIGKPLPVAVHVSNLGHALSSHQHNFIYTPWFTSVMPQHGSLLGGTQVVIDGGGFSEGSSNILVTFGGVPCTISSLSSNRLKCLTSPSVGLVGVVSIKVAGLEATCVGENCTFTFTAAATPTISHVSPSNISSFPVQLDISGRNFGKDHSGAMVMVGIVPCSPNSVFNSVISCKLPRLPAGPHLVTVTLAVQGRADGEVTVHSIPEAQLSPAVGSVHGGTRLVIHGNGFFVGMTQVMMNDKACRILSVSSAEVTCETPANPAGIAKVIISVGKVNYPDLTFSYSLLATPTILNISPTSGWLDSILTIYGSEFGKTPTDVAVMVGSSPCIVSELNGTMLRCRTGEHPAGSYPIVVVNKHRGTSNTNVHFVYKLRVVNITPTEGSFGGGQILVVQGEGFDQQRSSVLVCDMPCMLQQNHTSYVQLHCLVPPCNGSDAQQVCDVKVVTGTEFQLLPRAYTYLESLTAVATSIHPLRGGTAGGTYLTIQGYGFRISPDALFVTIAGIECPVNYVEESKVVCITRSANATFSAPVVLRLADQGLARAENLAEFSYVDVWSSPYTWGGRPPPEAGSLAVVGSGQTVLLDINTPVLKMLLIQGGKLLFDEQDIELQAENILVTDGGTLQVGTEEEPFQHKAIITLHGHLRTPELPIYGAKTLAVREGLLDLHGTAVPVTWTRLARTARAGSRKLHLELPVTWHAGDEVVIASTGDRHSQKENEQKTIASVSSDGRTLTLRKPLMYEHVSEEEKLPNGRLFEARAEVGLLTRNVVVRGSDNDAWSKIVKPCPEGFNTGEFATQTCFQGRFGEEMGSDQFGGCIMFHAPKPSLGLAIGRIEHVEIYHAGQAFRLGRYPIHWHLMGDVAHRSYVRGCSLHHTYNRAVTVHNTHNLTVERNVLFNIMGGALFIEDGAERDNVLEYNLAVFVRQSTSLLNDDVTPAAIWVTNPDNVIRHNAAAGGTHFGYWYRMNKHPDGPSFDPNVCQQRLPLGEFRNNSAHSLGWFGLWIFEHYYPMRSGACNVRRHPEPAHFHSLTAWHCEKGAEWVNGGALQFHDFVVVANEAAGVEAKRVLSGYVEGWGEDGGALFSGLTVVGHLPQLASKTCTSHGLVLPFSDGLSVSNVHFVNFDQVGCAAIGVTSIAGVCVDRCGGWAQRFSKIGFSNVKLKVIFRWKHEAVFYDLDGSLTGQSGSTVLPQSEFLDPARCSVLVEWSGGVPGAVCEPGMRFHRLAFHKVNPSSLQGKNVLLSSPHGVSVVPFLRKRLTHESGWMALLPSRETYRWAFEDAQHLVNISYSATFYGLKREDFIIIRHDLAQSPDRILVTGQPRNASALPLSFPVNSNGDWYLNHSTNSIYYIVTGNDSSPRRQLDPGSIDPNERDQSVKLQVQRCFYRTCQPPAAPSPQPPSSSGRPSSYDLWSNNTFWKHSQENRNKTPAEGEDVIVPAGCWLVMDIRPPTLNKLIVFGVLEIADDIWNDGDKPVELRVTYLFIQGGRLVVGYENDPFDGEAIIFLEGNHHTQDWLLPGGGNLGSKAIGVFGGLDMHGRNVSEYRAKLARTARAGSSLLYLDKPVGWQAGDEIVVSTTSYDAWQTETVRIKTVSTYGLILTLDNPLNHTHIGEKHSLPDEAQVYTLAADVGLLSRGLRIVGAEQPDWEREAFGARVLVGSFWHGDSKYQGYARISNVEFHYSGQEGYRDASDPRFSISFLGLEKIVVDGVRYIRGCSFHHGFAPAIGIFDTDGVIVEDNVIHHTVGEGVRVEFASTKLLRNLVTLTIWPGSFQDREEIDSYNLWPASIQVNEAFNVVLQGNIVAGFERIGFRIDGEPCSGKGSTELAWRENEAHGGLYGVYMNGDGLPGCSLVREFLLWRCWDYGIYLQVPGSVMLSNVSLIDNGMAIMTIVYGPPAISHHHSSKEVSIRDSVIVGSSPGFNCSDQLTNTDPNIRISRIHRSPRPPQGGRSGICWPTFSSAHNGAPAKPHAGLMSYNAISGVMYVSDTILTGFGEICSGQRDIAFMTNPLNEDLQHPIHVQRLRWHGTSDRNKVFIHRPSLSKVNPSDCVDMDCDAKKKTMMQDIDGSWLGRQGAVIPQAEFEWDGDPRHGVGDYRLPIASLMGTEGERLPINKVAPHKGIVRDSSCKLQDSWQAWQCHRLKYLMLVIESMDPDSETRRLSPVAVISNGYADLINGPQDHGWCSGYTCQRRLSLFHAIVANKVPCSVYFSSSSPQHLRLMLLNVRSTQGTRVAIYYPTPQRLDVYVGHQLVAPTNAAWNDKGTEYTLSEPTTSSEFLPQIDSAHGTNYFDPPTQLLFTSVHVVKAVPEGKVRRHRREVIAKGIQVSIQVTEPPALDLNIISSNGELS
uniref:Polycystic kidney and hepatic disease 1 (autosomal recessive)-like 1 n=1 Tax=Eptatretus burgeri TaxID=7764 RepID=A0A8C4N397_EPTBU